MARTKINAKKIFKTVLDLSKLTLFDVWNRTNSMRSGSCPKVPQNLNTCNFAFSWVFFVLREVIWVENFNNFNWFSTSWKLLQFCLQGRFLKSLLSFLQYCSQFTQITTWVNSDTKTVFLECTFLFGTIVKVNCYKN